jgi:hypothetical protein
LAGGRFFAVAFTDRTFFEDAPRFAATDLDFTIFFDFAFVLAAFLTAGFALERALGAAAAFALGRAFALAAALVRAFRGAGLRPDLPARARTRVFDTDLVLRFVLVAISGPCILTGTRSTLIHRNGMDKPASRACFTGLFHGDAGIRISRKRTAVCRIDGIPLMRFDSLTECTVRPCRTRVLNGRVGIKPLFQLVNPACF